MKKAIVRYLDKKLNGLRARWDRCSLPGFATTPRGLTFPTPRRIVNSEYIEIGHDCYIGPNSSLSACRQVGPPFLEQQFSGRIRLGNRVWATHGLQVFSADLVEICDDVMIAGNVFICDCQHGYANGSVPYKDQAFYPVKPIKIGAGSWLGQNVVIMPGVEIGAQCIVGANSVVTRSLPPASVAVGAPARVIRVYDSLRSAWHSPIIDPVFQNSSQTGRLAHDA